MARCPSFLSPSPLLLSPDPGDGGSAPPGQPANSDASTSVARPPAADAVIGSDAREDDAAEIVSLRRKLADEQDGRKRDQVRLSELEDENRRLKTPPPSEPKAKAQKRAWLDDVENFLEPR